MGAEAETVEVGKAACRLGYRGFFRVIYSDEAYIVLGDTKAPFGVTPIT